MCDETGVTIESLDEIFKAIAKRMEKLEEYVSKQSQEELTDEQNKD